MRKCLVHIGTHKTGTTSIQTMLNSHRLELARHGFLYPTAGIPSGLDGHHNIAWELSGDHRFRPDCGSVNDLLDEIDQSEHDIVISSEDFECAAHNTPVFETFIGALKQRGLEVGIVVYFRNQVDYVRSLYLELLQHGYDASFDEFIANVLEDRTVRWKQWVFAFCYRDFLKQLPAGASIAARSYDRAGSVIVDFTSILGLSPADLSIHADLRTHRQPPISAAFSAFYASRTGRSLEAERRRIVLMISRAFDGAGVDVSSLTRARLIAAYDQSNRFVESLCGFSGLVDGPSEAGGSTAGANGHPHLETIFSVTTVRLVDEVLRMFVDE